MEVCGLGFFLCVRTCTDGCFSSVIGMGFMILSFPIPGKLAQLVNNVQAERMKKVSFRFDWEPKLKLD